MSDYRKLPSTSPISDKLSMIRRNSLNLSQEHLADVLGTNQSRISRIENKEDELTESEITKIDAISHIPWSKLLSQAEADSPKWMSRISELKTDQGRKHLEKQIELTLDMLIKNGQ